MGIVICPICKEELLKEDKRFVCKNNHSFDISKYLYTNLLPSSGSHQHGDNLEMIRGRRDFLNKGHYAPLANEIVKLIAPFVKKNSMFLDAGCGEGYYSDTILSEYDLHSFGIDISKDALRVASQRKCVRLGKVQTFASSAYEMPFQDTSFDIILNVFSPFAKEEYLRLLKEDGILVFVIPDENHLMEMKSILYNTPYKNEVQDFFVDGFDLLSSNPISFPVHLQSQEEIHALFSMTPYYYRTPKDGREKLKSLTTLSLTASFYVLCYKKSR